MTRSAVSSAWLKVPRGGLAVIWDLAAAINVGSWRSPWRSNLGRPGIQVRMMVPKLDSAVPLPARLMRLSPARFCHLHDLSGRCRVD